MPDNVLPFEHLSCDRTDVAGGKGANLGELLRAGIPVPPGFVITTHAYRAFVHDAGIGERLASLVERTDLADRAALDSTAQEAQALIRDCAPPSCAADVLGAYGRMGGGLVAVRSSAIGEDSADASSAGQQATFLNIEGAESLLQAVRACWASLFEARAIYYRAQCGADLRDLAIAVPVQRMVQSERSGVAFTVDAVTHAHDTIVIEAVRGLGEALVCGAVTPDMYAVDKRTLQVRERTHVEQQRELAYAGGGGLETNEWRELSAVKRRRPKLNDEEIATLAAIVRRVEEHYGTPQDVEWAEAGGEFFIVQARPVTALAHAH